MDRDRKDRAHWYASVASPQVRLSHSLVCTPHLYDYCLSIGESNTILCEHEAVQRDRGPTEVHSGLRIFYQHLQPYHVLLHSSYY